MEKYQREQPEGEVPKGERPEGERPAGERLEGERPEGEWPCGDDRVSLVLFRRMNASEVCGQLHGGFCDLVAQSMASAWSRRPSPWVWTIPAYSTVLQVSRRSLGALHVHPIASKGVFDRVGVR
jgi:hypothetical protein